MPGGTHPGPARVAPSAGRAPWASPSSVLFQETSEPPTGRGASRTPLFPVGSGSGARAPALGGAALGLLSRGARRALRRTARPFRWLCFPTGRCLQLPLLGRIRIQRLVQPHFRPAWEPGARADGPVEGEQQTGGELGGPVWRHQQTGGELGGPGAAVFASLVACGPRQTPPPRPVSQMPFAAPPTGLPRGLPARVLATSGLRC